MILAQKCFCRPRVTTAPAFATALSASLLRSPQTAALRAIPYKLYWTTVSTFPSLGAKVSFRIGPLPCGPTPTENYFAFRENPSQKAFAEALDAFANTWNFGDVDSGAENHEDIVNW